MSKSRLIVTGLALAAAAVGGTAAGAPAATTAGFPLPVSAPGAAAALNGPSYVFARGGDGALYYEKNSGSGWSSATSLGGSLVHTPGAATGGNGTAEVFVRGLDNKLHWRLLVNGTWKPWATDPLGILASKPGVASWGRGRDDVFVRGAGSSSVGALYHRAFLNGAWGRWEGLGGQMLNGPGASSWGPGQLSVFVQGVDHQLWGRFYSAATGWTGWIGYGGELTHGPAAVSVPNGRQPGQVVVIVQGVNGAVYQKTIVNGRGGGWIPLGGALEGGPGASSTGIGNYRIVGESPNGHLYERVYSNGAWAPWTLLP